MQDDKEFQEEPLNFSHSELNCKCPYCAETLSTEEIKDHMDPEANIFICPNCRKKLNIGDLKTGI